MISIATRKWGTIPLFGLGRESEPLESEPLLCPVEASVLLRSVRDDDFGPFWYREPFEIKSPGPINNRHHRASDCIGRAAPRRHKARIRASALLSRRLFSL